MRLAGIGYRLNRFWEKWNQKGVLHALFVFGSESVADVKEAFHRTFVHLRTNDGLYLKNVDVGRMYLSVDDPGISRDLARKRSRESGLVRLIREEIRSNMVGFDIGANIGYYVVLEAGLVGRGGFVYAIEPMAENVEILRKNVEENGLTNVEILPIAISGRDQTSIIYKTRASNLASMLGPTHVSLNQRARDQRQGWTEERVSSLTVDSIVEQYNIPRIDFLRMDIEGYEFEVIEGMANLLEKSNRGVKLFIEVHNVLLRDVESIVVPWLEGLFSCGFTPDAIVVSDNICRDFDPNTFTQLVCNYRNSCPHILLSKK